MKVADRLAAAFIDESLTDRTLLAEQHDELPRDAARGRAARRLEEHREEAGRLQDEARRRAADRARQQPAGAQQPADADPGADRVDRTATRTGGTWWRRRSRTCRRPSRSSPNVTISGDDPTMVAGGSTAAQLEAARAQLRILEMRYKPDHPDVGRMKRVIHDLEAKQQAEALQRPLSPGAGGQPATPEEASAGGAPQGRPGRARDDRPADCARSRPRRSACAA